MREFGNSFRVESEVNHSDNCIYLASLRVKVIDLNLPELLFVFVTSWKAPIASATHLTENHRI